MSQPDYDAIILGQGLAGTTLAWSLHWRGSQVLVIDRDVPVTSSRIAAGLMTPITGQRLVKTWRWDQFWPAAVAFYRRVETEAAASFFGQKRLVRLLAGEYEQQYLARRMASEFVGLATVPQPLVNRDWFDDSWGGFEMLEGGRLNVVAFLDSSRRQFLRNNQFVTADLDLDRDIELTATGVRLPRLGVAARRLFFCQGIDASSNPWFQNVRFNPAKGEILDLRIEGLAEERIVHRGVWLMPVGNSLFRAGATYEWAELNSEPTVQGRDEICSRLREFLRLPFEVIGHKAAVRPILRHQYPVIGIHPRHSQLGFFNGLGSKGSLQAPWLADHLAGFLVQEHPLDPEVDLHPYERDIIPKITGAIPETSKPQQRHAAMPQLTEVAHTLVQEVLRPGGIAIDATVGNGHDTQFLADCVGPTGTVYGFDIQASALAATALRLAANGLDNALLLQRSHAEMISALPERLHGAVNAVMLNLGYLPGGDKSVTSRTDSTIAAIRDALTLLAPSGLMTILAYTGHNGGADEALAVEQFLKELRPVEFEVWEPALAAERKSVPRLFVVRRQSNLT